MAPQSAAHKRGGTHRVEDKHITNTIYDKWNILQLRDECGARGIPTKDVRKYKMARILADGDAEKKRAEHDALVEYQRNQQALQRERKKERDRQRKADAAKEKERLEKQERRDLGEDVSDDTPDEDEVQLAKDGADDKHYEAVQDVVGIDALSEESWYSSSIESSCCPMTPPIVPECRLRLFEWTYVEMPSPVARPPTTPPCDRQPENQFGYKILSITGTPISPTGAASPSPSPLPTPTAMGKRLEPTPRAVPYAPLKIHTSFSKEKLFLPGRTYPPGVDADFVPLLSPRTQNAARNGHLLGVLRRATIAPATSWTTRTQIQGWNARMFFSLPPRTQHKDLADVYAKWRRESRKLLRNDPETAPSKQARLHLRHAQRRKNKLKKLVEVLDASAYRPLAICYLPAYLDYASDDIRNTPQTLGNLYYIRFPGCDVPHYYFWSRTDEGEDPTRPNPEWMWDPEHVKARNFVSGKKLPHTTSTREDVQVLHEGELEALYRRGSIPGVPMGEKCEAWLENVDAGRDEVENLASSPDVYEEKRLSNGMDLTCPFCLEELGGMMVEVCCRLSRVESDGLISVQDHAEHMYSHSTVRQMSTRCAEPVEERPVIHAPAAQRQLRRISPVDNTFFDAGADGDTEKSPMERHFKAPVARATANRRKRPLDFLKAYEPLLWRNRVWCGTS
jgi:hypothetical protein